VWHMGAHLLSDNHPHQQLYAAMTNTLLPRMAVLPALRTSQQVQHVFAGTQWQLVFTCSPIILLNRPHLPACLPLCSIQVAPGALDAPVGDGVTLAVMRVCGAKTLLAWDQELAIMVRSARCLQSATGLMAFVHVPLQLGTTV
jgi:hypothetical protein